MIWIPIGLAWAMYLLIAAMQIWVMKQLRAARAELTRQREAVEKDVRVFPVFSVDRERRITSVQFDLGAIPAEGKVRFRIPVVRGLGKMTLDGPDERGDDVRLLVDFETGVVTRAADADGGLPEVPEAYHQAFDA